MSVLRVNQLPDVLLVRLQQMLHVHLSVFKVEKDALLEPLPLDCVSVVCRRHRQPYLVLLVSGEGHAELRQHLLLLRLLQLLLVDVVLVLMSAAKVQHRFSNLLSFRQQKFKMSVNLTCLTDSTKNNQTLGSEF